MDGCRRHGVVSTAASSEWDRVEQAVGSALAGLVADKLYAERYAQVDKIVVCHCCLAPALDARTVLCPTCSAADGCGCDYCKAVLSAKH